MSTTMTSQIRIGHEFFAKAKNDYADWKWAIVREFMQNSIDAGSRIVRISCGLNENGDTVFSVENDGDAMSREVLEGKLLCLGGSGKNFVGTVGGFGKAKELLYCCHQSYSIRSGDLRVDGCGAEYSLTDGLDFLDGTKSTIVIDGDFVESLCDSVAKFAKFAQWSGKLFLNGEVFDCALVKGARRRDFDFGVVYTNNSAQYTCVVRIGGIPMFTCWTNFNKLVVVELSGASADTMTSNRDGLIDPYRGQLNSFITDLAVDKKKALKAPTIRYEHFDGEKLSHRVSRVGLVPSLIGCVSPVVSAATATASVGVDVGADEVINESGDCNSDSVFASVVPNENGSISVGVGGSAESPSGYGGSVLSVRRVVTVGSEFVIKNETDLMIPRYYKPDSGDFSKYSQKLARIWGRLLVELHRLFDHQDEFAIGFVFDADGDTLAQHEYGDGFGRVYYISPAEVVEQRSSFSKSFSNRWKLTDRGSLIAIAAHEFTHGMGYSYHDESFANKYTEIMSKVLANKKRFTWCFA